MKKHVLQVCANGALSEVAEMIDRNGNKLTCWILFVMLKDPELGCFPIRKHEAESASECKHRCCTPKCSTMRRILSQGGNKR
jgi:hypothetical protein